MEPLFDDLCFQAAELGCFSIMLRDMPVYRDEWDCSLSLHQDVLIPLIASSVDCRLYGPVIEPRLAECLETRWKSGKRNTFELVEKNDPIRGQEVVWNGSCGIRGTIVIAVPGDAATACFSSFSITTSKPYLMSSLYQLKKGHTSSAIRYAQKIARKGLVAICLPSTNGCQWVDVFAAPKLFPALMKPCFENGDYRSFGLVF